MVKPEGSIGQTVKTETGKTGVSEKLEDLGYCGNWVRLDYWVFYWVAFYRYRLKGCYQGVVFLRVVCYMDRWKFVVLSVVLLG